jgi:hypothetical protein
LAAGFLAAGFLAVTLLAAEGAFGLTFLAAGFFAAGFLVAFAMFVVSVLGVAPPNVEMFGILIVYRIAHRRANQQSCPAYPGCLPGDPGQSLPLPQACHMRLNAPPRKPAKPRVTATARTG